MTKHLMILTAAILICAPAHARHASATDTQASSQRGAKARVMVSAKIINAEKISFKQGAFDRQNNANSAYGQSANKPAKAQDRQYAVQKGVPMVEFH